MAAEISVELTILLGKLKATAQQAAKELNVAFSKAGGDGMAKDTDKATKSQKDLTKAVKETASELKRQAKAAKEAAYAAAVAGQEAAQKSYLARVNAAKKPAWMSAEQGQKFTDPEEVAKRQALADQLRNQRRFSGTGYTASVTPIPAGLSTPKLAYPGATGPNPQFKVAAAPASMAQMLANLRNAVLPIGQILASFYLMKRAIDLALAPLRAFAALISRAVAEGRRLYASALTSGMGIGFTTKRGAIAQALGVSENEVMQFGKQIDWLGDRFNNSSRILASTAPTLAAVSWASSALQQTFKALWAQIANELAPVMVYLADAVRLFVETISNSDIVTGMAKELAVAFAMIATSIKVVMLAVSGLALIFQSLADTVQWVMIKINNLIARIPGAGKAGFITISDSEAFRGSKAIVDGIGKQLENNNPFKKINAPEPAAYMKQLGASAWEKMGLQIGGGGSMNYSQQTANHTKRAADLLGKIYQMSTNQRANITQPRGIAARA